MSEFKPIPVSEGLPLRVGDVCEDGYGIKETIRSIRDIAKYPVETNGGTYTLDGVFSAGIISKCDLVTIISRGPEPAQVARDQRMRENAPRMYGTLKQVCKMECSTPSACKGGNIKGCAIADIIKEIEGE